MRPSCLIVLAPLAAAAAGSANNDELAPLLVASSGHGIHDKYIVKFKDGSAQSIIEAALRALAHKAEHVYKGRFSGFAALLDKVALAALRNHSHVDYIEQDAMSSIDAVTEQKDAPWGLCRISHREKGADSYSYDDSAGAGTCAYIIDTGIDDSHPDFEGRARQMQSFVDGEDGDGHGHGTHVAGTVGSATYGVAKKTQLYGVKVLANSGHGANSAIIAGMGFVADDAKNRTCPKGVVANLSLGGSYSKAINGAARSLVDAGVFLGVAAGNSNANAADFSPASEPAVCTVGGTASDDTRYHNSNWGKPVDVLAPGVDILSTRAGGGSSRMSGTSMATPHIVGLAAYLGALGGLNGTADLCEHMRKLATPDAISNPPQDTVNKLAFNNASKDGAT